MKKAFGLMALGAVTAVVVMEMTEKNKSCINKTVKKMAKMNRDTIDFIKSKMC